MTSSDDREYFPNCETGAALYSELVKLTERRKATRPAVDARTLAEIVRDGTGLAAVVGIAEYLADVAGREVSVTP